MDLKIDMHFPIGISDRDGIPQATRFALIIEC